MIVRRSISSKGTDTEYRMAMSSVDLGAINAALECALEDIKVGGVTGDTQLEGVYALLFDIHYRLTHPEETS